MRRKRAVFLLTSACALLPLNAASAQDGPTVSLSITASDGNWTAYADTDSGTDNAGIATFAIDVIGTDGATVTGSYVAAPFGMVQVGKTEKPLGFTEFPSNGVGGGAGTTGAPGNGIAITGGQNVAYGATNSPNVDLETIQGFGKTPGSQDGITWTVPSEIAYGTYTAEGEFGGSLSVVPDTTIGHGIQTLSEVSNGKWIGPGNVSFDTVVLGSIIGPPSGPEPTVSLTATAPPSGEPDLAAKMPDDQIRITGGFGNYTPITLHLSSPLTRGYFNYSGFTAGDNVDVLLKFTNLAGPAGNDPATSASVLSDIENYVNTIALDSESPLIGVVTFQNLAFPVSPVVAAAFPGATYDLMLTAPFGSASKLIAYFDFGGFSDSSISLGDLAVSDIGIVPEPASAGVLFLGGVAFVGRRRNRSALTAGTRK